MSPVMEDDDKHIKIQVTVIVWLSKLKFTSMSFLNSEEITYKPSDISLMGRMLKMKFHVQDTGIYQYFTSKIVNYDGRSGKYGVYFLSDGEIVYMDPDDDDVFLT